VPTLTVDTLLHWLDISHGNPEATSITDDRRVGMLSIKSMIFLHTEGSTFLDLPLVVAQRQSVLTGHQFFHFLSY
jgi:hypothetical protein